ncbi:DASS family sodium-coupled anion symporter [Erythrobacter sp. SN021]|uniref:SLC13 family permease n=1 Tax=Erythrobacter sp. SN021 TaxID=2912574 RepID=UPI001F01F309|nr:DASS family sodium-coupled anion symporter [Erythrobacter sp. SN021]MCF8882719.1 DASS family sodium-coupled anion symporter [Erythrobacter sp. SN021]
MAIEETARSPRQLVGLWAGPLVFAAILFIPLPIELLTQFTDEQMPPDQSAAAARSAWVVLALLAFMAIWWVTEAVPIPVASLLPMVVLPLWNVAGLGDVAGEYLHPVVVLLLAGFILARSIERWNLHERIALNVVVRFGKSRAGLIGGFMMASAVLSMWISNTATAIMMVPIALSVAAALSSPEDEREQFTLALLLGIAFACSIGGLGTYIGTPTNLLIKDAIERSTGQQITFVDWMLFGLPAVIVLVPLAWVVLTRMAFKIDSDKSESGKATVKKRLEILGTLTVPERRVLTVFALVASLWVLGRPISELVILGTQPFAGLSDQVTALLGVFLCFIIPAGSASQQNTTLLDWRTAESIPWGVVLLFGGGMALAAFIRSSGLGDWIGGELEIFATLPVILLIAIVTTVIIFVTEITSNVATAAASMPVLVALAERTGLDVVMLAAPVALAASCAFMLPMATGPNAVIHATDRVPLPTMARAGLRLNLAAIPVITILAYFLAPVTF